MNFLDMIKEKTKYSDLNEAPRINIDTISKNGTSYGEMLQAFYAAHGTNSWGTKEAVIVKKPFAKDAPAHQYRLIQDGYLDRNGRVYSISRKGLDWLTKNTNIQPITPAAPAAPDEDSELDALLADEEDTTADPEAEILTTKAKGVSDVTKLKSKKFKVPVVGKNSKYLSQMRKLLNHMDGFAQGEVKTSFMLGGDPGTGKTSFIRSLSVLTGIPLVVIEAPHITQEHLINIPFLVIDGDKETAGNVTVDDSNKTKMKVVQAESNLVTQLKKKRKKTPEQIQRQINKSKLLKELYPKVKFGVNKIRGAYNSILFLDEFYRAPSIKIRNVLRNILNGKIGNDKIPQGVYIVMATNINDEGVEDIPLNQDFHLMNYDVSSKDDFMNYMYSKYVSDPDNTDDEVTGSETGISIQQPVWNKFMDVLSDDLLGYNDDNADVRLSPRRIEQMMIYIDAALPITSVKDAQNLLAFTKTNLSNYMEEEESKFLFEKFEKLTLDLIEETNANNVPIDRAKLRVSSYNKTAWRDQLQHELELKLKLGENRSYIPVVSGLPGIGKTSQMISMADDMEMGYIQVDVSNLTPEDITGMPIANMGEEAITTEFSEPNLYISIMKDYNSQIEQVRKEGRKYNVILLFDELNRGSVPVFNSIRKVLLEKSFENVKLPDDIIVTGAINPGDEGTIEFTSHTRDVIDIIPSGGHFGNTVKYISNKKSLQNMSKRVGFDLHGGILNIMSQLALEFKSTVDNAGKEVVDVNVQPFWWDDGSVVFYISPREMTECISNATKQVENALGYMGYEEGESYDDAQYEEFITECIDITADSFVDSFNMIVLKQDIERFSIMLGKKIQGNTKFRKMFENIRTSKSANIINLVQTLESAEGDINYFSKKNIGDYINNFSSSEMVQEVSTIVDEYFKEINGDSDVAIEVVGKTLDLHKKLTSILKKLNASNNYTDQINKNIGGRIVALLNSDDADIFKFIENDKIMKRLENLI